MTEENKNSDEKPAESPDIKIHCTFDEMVSPKDLKPHPRNPNTHESKQVKLLAEIIRKTGFRNSIVVSKLSGFVVHGHCRLESALVLGMDQVPVDYQEYESTQEEETDLIADNKIAELATIDEEMVKDILKDLEEMDVDLSMTALNPLELNRILSEGPKLPSVGVPDKEKNIIIKLSVHPGIWLSKREEILGVCNQLKATYDAGYKIKE